MRFQSSQAFTTPIPTPTMGVVGALIPPWTVVSEPSGTTGIMADTVNQMVLITGLLITWSGVTTAGELDINIGSGSTPIIIHQSTGGGSINLPMNTLVDLGTYGIQVTNNSVGGNYSVTAFMQEV